MSLVSFLGGYSAALILTNEENIDIDVSYDGNPFDGDPTDFEIDIEFEINNQGYFDLEDLEVELKLLLIYDWANKSGDDLNVTTEVKLYEGDKSFATVPAGEKKKFKLGIDYDDLEPINFSVILKQMDKFRDPVFDFEAEELEISAKYSLGLISFKAEIEDMDLGGFEEAV
jgi:hypothetical protein